MFKTFHWILPFFIFETCSHDHVLLFLNLPSKVLILKLFIIFHLLFSLFWFFLLYLKISSLPLFVYFYLPWSMSLIVQRKYFCCSIIVGH
jgi:hypothetical protein